MSPKTKFKSDIITGIARKNLSRNHLPSEFEIISFFRYQHENQRKTIGESIQEVATETIAIWEHAGLPHQLKRNVVRRIAKLVGSWQRLKKACMKKHSRTSAVLMSSKHQYRKMFNISATGIENELKGEGKRAEFWRQQLTQRDPVPFPSSFGSVVLKDSNCSEPEIKRIENKPRRPTRVRDRVEKQLFVDEVNGTRRSKRMQPLTEAVIENIDRARVTNREGVGVLAATAAALGVDPTTLSLSKSTLHRKRKVVSYFLFIFSYIFFILFIFYSINLDTPQYNKQNSGIFFQGCSAGGTF